jgi:hypothetical protein
MLTPFVSAQRSVKSLNFTTIVKDIAEPYKPFNGAYMSYYSRWANCGMYALSASEFTAGFGYDPHPYWIVFVDPVHGPVGLHYDTAPPLGTTVFSYSGATGNVQYQVALKNDKSEIAVGILQIPGLGFIRYPWADPTVYANNGARPAYTAYGKPVGYSGALRGSFCYEYTLGDVLGALFFSDAGDLIVGNLETFAYQNAFMPETAPDSFQGYHCLSTGGYNYTLVDENDGGTGPYSATPVYFSKWQPVDLSDPTSFENFSLSLDNPDDDAIFQDIISAAPTTFGRTVRANGGGGKFIVCGIYPDDLTVTRMKAFVFDADFANYDRINIVSDGSLQFGSYYQDALGGEYLGGIPADESHFRLLSGTLLPDDGGIIGGEGGAPLRAYTITQDDHDFWICNLGDGRPTIVLDLMTEQWSTWESKDLPRLRISDGFPWDFENVGGDYQAGLLWTLDGNERVDDAVSGSVADRTPIQLVLRGLYPNRLRKALGCFRATLTVGQGDPAAGGVGILLRTSDDMAQTFQDHGFLQLDQPGKQYDISWVSLGLITEPGRIFEIVDTGYATRIEALDIDLGDNVEGAASNGQ